ncbi:MAG: tetratricopeptide repeat protein [Deltaproteobacteria bacterium]|nr:tetratricopeptide repeat protein [Deltaproteobacteria bacterium]
MQKLFLVTIALGVLAISMYWLNQRPNPSPSVAEPTLLPSPSSAVPETVPQRREIPQTTRHHKPAIQNEAEIIGRARRSSPAEAYKLLKEALRKNPNSSDLQAEMGRFLMEAKHQTKEAIAYFEKSIRLNPENSDALAALVAAYAEQKVGASRGMAFFKELFEKNPDQTLLYLAMGDLLAREGHTQEAIRHLEKAAIDSSDRDSVGPYLATLYLKVGKAKEAAELYRNTLKELERRHADNRARGVAEPALEQEIAWANLDLANALLKSGNDTEAERYLQRALEKNPQDPFAKALLQELKTMRSRKKE